MAVGRGTASTALLGDMRSGNALGNAARPLVGDGVLSMRHLVKTNYSLSNHLDAKVASSSPALATILVVILIVISPFVSDS